MVRHTGGALGGRPKEAASSRRGLPPIPGETAGGAERRGSPAHLSLSGSVATLWHAPGTSAVDRKQIVRCVVERVVVVADKATELNDVTIIWHGGVTTRHEVARPVASFEQLKDYRRLRERITNSIVRDFTS